jgi:hypothetical protein
MWNIQGSKHKIIFDFIQAYQDRFFFYIMKFVAAVIIRVSQKG